MGLRSPLFSPLLCLSSAGIGPGGARLEVPTAHPVTSVEHLAAAAVMDAFALARECWAAGQPMASLFTSRTVPPPRGLQAVLASFIPPPPQLQPGLVPEAMEWGATHLRGFPLPLLLEGLEAQYLAEAAQYLPAGQPTPPPAQQQYPQQQQQQQERSGTGSGGQPWRQQYPQQSYPPQPYPQQQPYPQPGNAPDGSTRKREPSDAHSTGAYLINCWAPSRYACISWKRVTNALTQTTPLSCSLWERRQAVRAPGAGGGRAQRSAAGAAGRHRRGDFRGRRGRLAVVEQGGR